MCDLQEFLKCMYLHLTGKEASSNCNLIRVHTKKLDVLGDLSFPLSVKSWSTLLDNTSKEDVSTIFDYLNSGETLIEKSRSWTLPISKVARTEGNVAIHLYRQHIFRSLIRKVLRLADKFGSEVTTRHKQILISTPESQHDLTSLKTHTVKSVVKNLLIFTNCNVIENDEVTCGHNFKKVVVTSSSVKCSEAQVILIGPVVNSQRAKDTATSIDDLYKKRSIDVRLMAEHKYGLRTTSGPGWAEYFHKLGQSSVIIHLLQNKPQHTTMVKLSDPNGENIKGASFILYNCARISMLLKNYGKKVSENVYPSLPNVEDINFELLCEPEEWELLFVYVLQFPRVIENCIKDVENGRVNPHYLVSHLQNLSSVFSVYYRRVRILMEPREHLYPLIFQRIYLAKVLQQVMNTGLMLLDIEPVSQM